MTEASLSTGTRRQKLLFKCVTQDGAKVVLSGNVPELGEWVISAALQLHPQPRQQGGVEWSAQVELPLGQTLEYKYVKQTEYGQRWENGNNHRITVIPGLHTLDSDFRD